MRYVTRVCVSPLRCYICISAFIAYFVHIPTFRLDIPNQSVTSAYLL